MLLTKLDSSKYIAEFRERFSNFAQKAPVLLSFITTDAEVRVVHENSGTIYTFQWDFSIPVKSFIHEIKQVLSDNHYPRVVKVETKEVALTPQEQAELLMQGQEPSSLPTTKIVEEREVFKIDRVIALKDIFLLESENDYKIYRYKMNYSSIFFLKNYRTGKYKSIEEAGKFFFGKSELLNEMIKQPG
jgi:hypothetical protein